MVERCTLNAQDVPSQKFVRGGHDSHLVGQLHFFNGRLVWRLVGDFNTPCHCGEDRQKDGMSD